MMPDVLMPDALADLPPIATGRLRLRPLREADAPALVAVTNDSRTLAIIPFLPSPFTLDDARGLLREATAADRYLGIFRRDSDGLVGVVGLHARAAPWLEIGYWVAPEAQGHGIAREAAAAVLRAVAAAMPERRVFAVCREDNVASRRILTGLGLISLGPGSDGPGRFRFELPRAATLS